MPLPPLSGSFVIGVCDIEHEDLLFRMFYPAQPMDANMTDTPRDKQAGWLLSYKYGGGYGRFMNIPGFISVPVFAALYSRVTIPHSIFDAPIMKAEKLLPLVLFSHGLGGMRTTYSAICSDLASHGFLVVCLEHQDQSASLSLRKNASQIVNYKPLPTDVDEFEFRNNQLKFRVQEIVKAQSLLKRLNSGETIQNTMQSEFDLSSLNGRIDFDNTVVMGHSFGGGTAVQANYYHSELFQCAISLDGWMFPVNREVFEGENFPNQPKPFLFINSEIFQWAENLDRMKKLIRLTNEKRKSIGKNLDSTLITISGSGHQNQTDFALLTPAFALGNQVGPIDATYCLKLNTRMCLRYLRRFFEFGDQNLLLDSILNRDTALRPKEISVDSEFLLD